MRRLLNRFSTEEKVSIVIKSIAIGVLVLLVTGCSSIRLGFNSQPVQVTDVNAQYPVKTYTTDFQTFKNLNPEDLGLHSTGNWIHCRHHGFHDLNDWTDFSYSPRFCRLSDGFARASAWNWNWGGSNYWNNNWMWNPRSQYNYWGNNWSPWMGNVHYGYGNNYGMGGYHGWGQQNTWYWSNGYYGGNYMYGRRSNMNGRRGSLLGVYPRATNRSGRWESTTPVRRVNTPTRTRTNVTPRTTPTRTRTNVTPRTNVRPTRTNVRPTRTNIPTRTNVRPTRTNVRPTRTNTPTRRTVTPPRTNTRPSSKPTRTNTRKQR
ncbi:hypothetical protein N9P49_00450 [bacterium]|nr:hypothetical protein [bacterium]